MSKDTGGPAFPVGSAYAGITVRDYFAAKALQGLLSNVNGTEETLQQLAAGFAEHAYRQADAMLAERSKP